LLGIKGKIPALSPVNTATLYAKQGGKISINLPEVHNALLYLLDGEIVLDGYGIVEGLHAVVFQQDGEGVSFEAKQDTRLLLVSGEPLNEEVVSYGPFVMNTQTQIMEAMRDYQTGKMGVLIED
jgi:quercetin 2,3-dioxygenase